MLALSVHLFGQSDRLAGQPTAPSTGNIRPSVSERVSLATADPAYPVTPGDSLQVSYMGGMGTVSIGGVVDAHYRLDLGFFGSIDARGMSFPELRERISDLVRRAYPSSYPLVTLSGVGAFLVPIEGAVTTAGDITAWSLMRLSEAVSERMAAHGSERRVTVTRADGASVTYDLFLARRGEAGARDPYLRPGDSIVVGESLKKIELSGEIERPGLYEVLPAENLERIIEFYGGGITPRADARRVAITRFDPDKSAVSRLTLDYTDAGARRSIPKDRDLIHLDSLIDRLPVVYLEGAVLQAPGPAQDTGSAGEASGATPEGAGQTGGGAESGAETTGSAERPARIRVPIYDNDTLYAVLARSRAGIAPSADLGSGFIRREGFDDPIEIDMERLLYGKDLSLDIPVAAGDRIVLPTGAIEVFVQGEVIEAGYVEVDSLTRLSDFLEGRLTRYASIRNVNIASVSGAGATFDLFLAERFGRIDQDPYLQPDDRINVAHVDRQVRISGEVERPGVYELLPDEGIRELIDYYAGGSTDLADLTQVEVIRSNTGTETPLARIVVDLGASEEVGLRNLDNVVVPNRLDLLPVVYIEGALKLETAPVEAGGETSVPAQTTPAAPAPARKRISLREGDTLYTILGEAEEMIDDRGDLSRAFVRRDDGKVFEIDMERLRFQKDLSLDFALEPGDTVVIPYGTTEVFVQGEVTEAGYVEVDPLTRLSDFLTGRLTRYASKRSVHVASASGVGATFDLFLAERFGRIDQDPYLKPGDRITVGHLDRRVRISGEVERPGVYELLPDDGIRTLIDYYSDGSTDLADLAQVEVIRSNTGSETPVKRIVVDLAASADGAIEDLELRNLDSVVVPNRLDLLPVVYVEGALKPETTPADAGGEAAGTAGTAESTATTAASPGSRQTPGSAQMPARRRVALREGDTLYTILREAEEMIDDRGDLSRAFVRREDGKVYEIDMERLLFQKDLSLDFALEPGDAVVIPYGTMEVFLTGEVTRSRWMTVEPLTRLSAVVEGMLTDYSSTRTVVVTSKTGASARFDLFLAERFGRKDQDPYVRSGDTIAVERADRKVTIQGEVEREGTYELLPGEELEELVSFYGGGLTIDANPGAVEVIRSLTADGEVTRKVYVDYSIAEARTLKLVDGDLVTVPSKLLLMPYVFFEGAVLERESEEGVGTELLGTSRFRYRFHSGELLSETLEKVASRFSAVSDLENAYVVRHSGETIPIDMEALLRRSESAENIRLEPYDRIVIPFKQYFVIVSGAVRSPGRYPYIPDRNYRYYVNLAGGFDTELHLGDRVRITDINDQAVRAGRYIEPETKIYAPINNPLYYINQLSGVLGVLGTILSILAITGAFGAGGV